MVEFLNMVAATGLGINRRRVHAEAQRRKGRRGGRGFSNYNDRIDNQINYRYFNIYETKIKRQRLCWVFASNTSIYYWYNSNNCFYMAMQRGII